MPVCSVLMQQVPVLLRKSSRVLTWQEVSALPIRLSARKSRTRLIWQIPYISFKEEWRATAQRARYIRRVRTESILRSPV